MMTMTADQYARLSVLQSKLFDALEVDADPKNWSGHGHLPKEWSQETRGNAYWCRKNAAATMSLVVRVQQIFRAELTVIPRPESFDEHGELALAQGDNDVDIDKEITRYEREAAKLITRARGPG